jgi:non-ribosomal peptide synthetase component E (peptide arylation enzyme)
VEIIDQMPLTGTGKLWKMKLRERFKDYRLAG